MAWSGGNHPNNISLAYLQSHGTTYKFVLSQARPNFFSVFYKSTFAAVFLGVSFGYSLKLTYFTLFSLFQAYHFFLLAQRQMYEGAIDAAMKTVSNKSADLL